MLIALVFIISIPLQSFGMDGQIKIAQTTSTAFPIVINKAGSYVLTSNLDVSDPNKNAIEITVNDVTLDLNGHTIQGPATGGMGAGIYAPYRYNIAIRNGRIWGFGTQGISLSTAIENPSSKGAGHRIEEVQVVNNYEGIVIVGGVVKDCAANNNKINCGICAYNSIVIDCVANNNTGSGIFAKNSTVINNTTSFNNSIGIQATEECYLAGNNARNNTGYGLYLPLNGANYAIKNVASDSGVQNYYVPTITPTGNYQPFTGDNANHGF